MLTWTVPCECCGKPYEVSSARYSKFCSNACKQKAYRARVKAQKEASAGTMVSAEYKVYDAIVKARPAFVNEFISFRELYGFEATVDMMLVVYSMIGVGNEG